MRIKTLPQIVKVAKELDPDTALNESMLVELMASGNLPYEKHGNRTVTDMDTVIPCLNRMLGLNADASLPRLRTIRGAVRELRQCRSELGIGEDHIREAVNDGRMNCIRIGNRAYSSQKEKNLIGYLFDCAIPISVKQANPHRFVTTGRCRFV